MDTSQYGGRTITKNITLVTNDPVHRNNVITLAGSVEAFALMSPRFVRLSAPVGDPVVETLTITGNPKYPFHITGTRQVPVNADKFKHKIELVAEKPVPVYRLKVTNLQKHNGTYYGSIYLTTDSPIKKEIPVSVQGNIFVPRTKTSGPAVRPTPYVHPRTGERGGGSG